MILRQINSVLHAASFLTIVSFGDYEAVDLLLIGACLFTAWGAGHIALRLAGSRQGNGLGLLTLCLIVFFWVAYTSKLGLAILIAPNFWVVPILVSEELLVTQLPYAFFMATVSYVAVLFAVLSSPWRHHIEWQIRDCKPRYMLILSLVCIGLVFKYFLKTRFNLGVPGLDPIQMGVPYLAGALAILLEFGFLFFANIPFFLALYGGRRFYLGLALLVAFMNAAIDLSFGSKDMILYQMVVTACYLFIFYQGLVWRRAQFLVSARTLVIFLVIAVVGILFGYKYVNFFRYALLSGVTDISVAMQIASESDLAQSRSSIMQLYNRITGLEALSAVMYWVDGFSSSQTLLSMIDGTRMQNFTEMVMNGRDSNAAFSMTLVGYWYAVGGIATVLLGFLITGLLLSTIQYWVVKNKKVPNNMKLAFLPVLWIMFASLMLGGNPLIWLKSIIVTLIVYLGVSRIAIGRDSYLG